MNASELSQLKEIIAPVVKKLEEIRCCVIDVEIAIETASKNNKQQPVNEIKPVVDEWSPCRRCKDIGECIMNGGGPEIDFSCFEPV